MSSPAPTDDDDRSSSPQPAHHQRSAGSEEPPSSPVAKRVQKEEDEDEEEADAVLRTDSSKRRNNDDDDDDDDDEDDEDEDDEDEDDEEDEGQDTRGRRRPHKKQKRNRFIDIEAEVDDEDEDLDEDEDDFVKETADFIDHDGQADDREGDARAVERHNQLLDRRRREFDDRDAERIAEEFRERHVRSQAARFKGDTDQVPQRLLMPSVDDPNLWQVRVKPGRERDIVFSIMRKSIDLEYSPTPLEVYSAFQRDSLPGMIYVEARSLGHVENAIRGLVGVFVGRGINLVPIEEMSSLLKLKKKVVEIVPGTWVRIKRGKYQGDLAQVLDVTENGEEVGLKFIPRIDMAPKDDAAEKKRKKGSAAAIALAGRPPLRFFSHEEVARAYGARSVISRGGSFIFQGDTFKNGFLEKDVKVMGISTENVDPTLEEISRFAGEKGLAAGGGAGGDGVDGADLSMIAETARKNAIAVLQPGDHVEVYEGEQTGLLGLVESIAGEIVTIRASKGALKGQSIEVPGRSVRKNFRPGDHVKVMAGSNTDETGLVLSITGNIVTFLSDLNQQEVTVFSKDIREASEVGNGANQIGQYELHDLVQLDVQTSGVIFKTERDAFRVLDQTGAVKTVQPHQISSSKNARQAKQVVAIDSEGLEVRIGTQVQEVEGEHRKGTILQIYRSTFIWLYNREIQENSGVFVLRNRQITSAAAKTKATTDYSKQNPIFNVQTAQPALVGRGPRDRLIDTHVVVVKGINKGMIGTVKDVNADKVRVELQSGNKMIVVPRSSLRKKDLVTGKTSDLDSVLMPPPMASGAGGAYGNPNMPPPGSLNPYLASNAAGRTPNPYASQGGQTPAYAIGRTPNPYAGGQTPAWIPGSATPRAAGGRTPAYGNGRTPAWQPDSRTPAWQPDSGRTPAGAGGFGRTPAGAGGSSRTPAGAGASAWNASATPAGAGASAYDDDEPSTSYGGASVYGSTADTPGAGPYQGAPTPGAGYSSGPTPGPYGGAPTPAPYGSAPTPAPYGSAPTPGALSGAYSAPTPGAYGGGAPTPGPAYGASASAPTPGGWGGGGAPTPGGPGGYAAAATPGAGPSYGQTPGASYATPAGAPTPGALGGAHAGGGGYTSSELSPDWVLGLSNIFVQITTGRFAQTKGTLLSADPARRTALVKIHTAGGLDMNLSLDSLAPLEPDGPGQNVVGVKGAYRGREMRTFYRNDDEWQVEFPGSGEKMVVPHKALCQRAV